MAEMPKASLVKGSYEPTCRNVQELFVGQLQCMYGIVSCNPTFVKGFQALHTTAEDSRLVLPLVPSPWAWCLVTNEP